MNWKNALTICATLLTPVGLLAQQGPGGPQGPGAAGPRAFQPGLDMARVQNFEGDVTAVRVGYGLQFPVVTVNGRNVKVAPIWYLLDNDFEIAEGQKLAVRAAPSLRPDDPYLYALQLTLRTETQAGITLMLRTETGMPLWSRSGGPRIGPGPGPGGPPQNDPPVRVGGTCIDTATLRTATGTIEGVNAGIGIQFPSLELLASSGQLLTIKLAPERVLLGSDFELAPGAWLMVKYATATCANELVAIELTDAAGRVLTLRYDDGAPGWR